MQKRVFFNSHKQKNIVEYKETFLEKIKVFFPYLGEFSKDKSILPKEYPKDCKMGGSIKNQLSW